MYLTTTITSPRMTGMSPTSLALRCLRRRHRLGVLDGTLEDPRVVGLDFLVVVLVHALLGEAVTLVEPLCVTVGDLDVEIDRGDLGFRVGGGGIDEMLEALRSNTSGPVRLGGQGAEESIGTRGENGAESGRRKIHALRARRAS